MSNTVSIYYAHSTKSPDRSNWHLLKDHLLATGQAAAERAAKFGAGRAGDLAGRLHDLGKYCAKFQARLDGSGAKIDHSTAGAQVAAQTYGALGKLIAFCVAGHHAGLADGDVESGTCRVTALVERLRSDTEPLDPRWQNEIHLPAAAPRLALEPHDDPRRLGFQVAFFTRMLFSCLVDADYLDTEAFYDRIEGRPRVRGGHPPLAVLREQLDGHLARLGERATPSSVNRIRAEILAHVRNQAAAGTGLFSLTVPTGGGKTLASLAFALDHAIAHGLDRVIYVIPFTSIIEQTAAVFRDALAPLGDEAVLEHHCAFDEERIGERQQREKLHLAMENWDVPIVVTTAVQFFESLFASRPSRCRKLHNIAKSVVILDEAQTLPLRQLRPCVAALDELARNYRTSIVLCTATQPALAEEDTGGFAGGLRGMRELAPEPARLHRALRRATIRDAGVLDDAELASRLADASQALCIVNSRAHARDLFASIAEIPGASHLTTLMCASHRSATLARIRQALKVGAPCRVVATSLIEAGVDVDFPVVFRAAAGLDSIAQAAGRCNREGRGNPDASHVYVFEAPGRPPPAEVNQFARAAREVLRLCPDDPLSPVAVRRYFELVYWLRGELLDARDILGRLHERAATNSYAFDSIARDFRVIESPQVPLIVPPHQVWSVLSSEGLAPTGRDAFDRADAALRSLERVERPGPWARLLQPFTVQIPPHVRSRLMVDGAASAVRPDRFERQFVVLRNPSLYRPRIGLDWNDHAFIEAESLIL